MTSEQAFRQRSDAPYMNPGRQEFFRQSLLHMRRQLLETMEATGQYLRRGDLLADPFDHASPEESRRFELRLCKRESAIRSEEIQADLRRLEEGNYGWCRGNRRADRTAPTVGTPRRLAVRGGARTRATAPPIAAPLARLSQLEEPVPMF